MSSVRSIHRFRSGWIAARTAQVNTLRGLLRELGLFIPKGIERVLPQVRFLIADADSGIPDRLRATIAAACDPIQLVSVMTGESRYALFGGPRPSPPRVVVLMLLGYSCV